jgi:HK97 family phage major capsid protein
MKTKIELLARITELKDRIIELDKQYEGALIDPESQDGKEWNAINAEHDQAQAIVAQMDVRAERVGVISKVAANREEGASFHVGRPGVARGEDIYDLSTIRSSVATPEAARLEMHDRAKAAIEATQFPLAGAPSSQKGEGAGKRPDQDAIRAHVENLLVNCDNEAGDLARRILATGSPTYQRAFGKAIQGLPLQGAEFSALSVGTGSAGGFAVPYVLDPTIIPTSDQAVNPYRAISRIIPLVGSNEWRGVTSAGVTAHRRNEGDESADDSPTLAQPTVRPQRVDVFIPFSIELEQDWASMASELARLIQDAKDVEEATSFTVGNGTAPNPEGLITNLAAAGTTTVVKTGATATFASTDLDLAEEALGPRFQARAQWVGQRATYNLTRHFATNNGPDLWVRIAEGLAHGGNTGRTLLGYAANEASAMDIGTATGKNLLVLGDFNYFAIIDRIGMQIELVQHLFGSNGRPTGQRGFYAFWRNTCKVLSPNAFALLQSR